MSYYLARREQHIAGVIRWQAENPEKVRQYKTKSRRNARFSRPWQIALYCASARCKKNGLPFEIDAEWCRSVWTGVCELSGLPFELGATSAHPYSPSLDRIDPKQGYTKNNCRFVLWALNRFKSNYTDDVMLNIARALVAKSNEKAGSQQ